jgi:hypothetical protein
MRRAFVGLLRSRGEGPVVLRRLLECTRLLIPLGSIGSQRLEALRLARSLVARLDPGRSVQKVRASSLASGPSLHFLAGTAFGFETLDAPLKAPHLVVSLHLAS